MKQIRTQMKKVKKVFSMLLVVTILLGIIPGSVVTVNAASNDTTTKVVVSVEGQTLGHGFYIEPTVVTYDEFMNYWSERGQSILIEDITAGGMIDYVLTTKGYTRNDGQDGSISGPGYLKGIDGIRAGKGDAVVPECLADDGITVTQQPGTDLYEKSYTSGAGWMYTEGNWMSDQAMAGHKFSKYGKPYTLNGESYYVVRLQYTIAGLGADLGFDDFGTSYGYHAADKGNLYVLYAKLIESGFFENNQDEREAALAIMNKLDASQKEVDDAYKTLVKSGYADEPKFDTDLSADTVAYEVDEAAKALTVVASVADNGNVTYQWFESTDKLVWKAIDGATKASYTPSTADAGKKYYKCVATNTNTPYLANTADSTVACVLVGDAVKEPVIATDLPAAVDYTWKASGQQPLEVIVTEDASAVLSYQWYKGIAGAAEIDKMTAINGATQSTYMPDISKEGTTVYACRITNTLGSTTASVDSTLCTVTVANSVVMISNEQELYKMKDNLAGKYQLANDITMKDNWVPLYNGSSAGFTGTLDGNGYTIYNFTVDSNDTSYGGGLFGYTQAGAVIQNLGIAGSINQNKSNVSSALIGAIYGTTKISNCYVDLSVTGGMSAAGLVGDMQYAGSSVIENCYSTGSISSSVSNAKVAGLVGVGGQGEIKNCYTTSNIAVGNYGGTKATNVYSAAGDTNASKIPVDMDEFVSSLGSAFAADSKNINSGYPVLSWQVNGIQPDVKVTGVTLDQDTLEFTEKGAAAQLSAAVAPGNATNKNVTWASDNAGVASVNSEGKVSAVSNGEATITVTTEDGSFTDTCAVTVNIGAAEIATEDELRAMKADGSYKLTADIEVTGTWTPLANFSGTLDGNGHIISGLNVALSGYAGGGGLFASTAAGAVIKNLGLEGSVTAASGGTSGVLIGKVSGSTTISGCYVNADMTGGNSSNVGGIVGQAGADCVIENCYYTGKLTGSTSQWYYTGGIISDSNNNKATIRNCYTTADKVAGQYGWSGVDTSKVINSWCGSANDQAAQLIPADKEAFLAALGDAYAADIADINNGYPILKWQEKEIPVPVEKTVLNEAIAEAKKLNEKNYTEGSWEAFQTAIEEAERVSNNESAVQEEVDAQISALEAATKALVDISELKALVDEVKDYQQEDYTSETWTAFDEALEAAETVLADKNAAQEKADNALKALETAKDALVEVSEGPVEGETIQVSFTLLGDDQHEDGDVHTYSAGNLQTWVEGADYEVSKDATVKDVLDMVLEQNEMTCENPSGNYVKSITRNGITLGEYTNGTFSRWMYLLNGKHSGLGVAEQNLEEGDEIIFHYTDDFTKEGNTPDEPSEDEKNKEAADKVINLINEIGTVTLERESNIKAARVAYEALTDVQKGLVDNYAVLEAAETRYQELENANYVEKLIDAIGEVTLKSGPSIEAARNAFDALTDVEKELVANYNKLTDAEKKYEKLTGETQEPKPTPDPNPGEDKETVVLVNKKYGVSLKGEGLDANMELVVTPLGAEDNDVVLMRKEITSDKSLFRLYNIKLMKDGKEIELPEKCIMTIPVGDKYDGQEMSVLFCSGSKVMKLKGKAVNGSLAVEVEELGSFGVVFDTEGSQKPGGGTENGTGTGSGNGTTGKGSSVKTGDETPVRILFSLLAVSMAGIAAAGYKKRVR